MQNPWLWLKQRPHVRRRIVMGAAIIAGIIGGFFLFLVLYFWFGDDLTINLEATQASFNISNIERANAQIAITTTGQLFCTAMCDLTLRNMSTNAIDSNERFTVRRGERIERNFTLAAGGVGEGQTLYSVALSCHNLNAPLCPTLSPERRKTQLLIVNYGLPSTEAAMRPVLKQQLEEMLSLLRQADIALGEVQSLLAKNPRLQSGELLTRIAKTQDDFYAQRLFLEGAQLHWEQQSYLLLHNILQNSTVDRASINDTINNASAIKGELLSLAQRHNDLRNSLSATRDLLTQTIAPYPSLPGSAALANPLIEEMNGLVLLYGSDSFSYAQLDANITAARNRTATLRSALFERNQTISVAGLSLIAAQREELCARNITCDNTTYPSQLAGICAELNTSADMLRNVSQDDKARGARRAENTTSNVTLNATLLQTATYLQANCLHNNTFLAINMTGLSPVRVVMPENITSSIVTTLSDAPPRCCVFGECGPCCNTAACTDDPATYPVIFVHGHSFNSFNSPEYSLGGYFAKIQSRMQEDGYLDAGIITPSSTVSEVGPGEWGLSGRPVTLRVTYYYNFYRSGDDYTLITQKSENIETYAIRLKEMIDIAKHHTGKQKVNVVAHSMGGLVVRRYIQMFGEDSIDKVILIGTPNAGITARTKTLCPVFGESKECEDMEAESVFMRKVNDAGAQPTDVTIVTITGHGCDTGGADGDGVVQATSVPLSRAKNYAIDGACSDFFGTDLHTEMLNIDAYPAVYDIIRDELKK